MERISRRIFLKKLLRYGTASLLLIGSFGAGTFLGFNLKQTEERKYFKTISKFGSRYSNISLSNFLDYDFKIETQPEGLNWYLKIDDFSEGNRKRFIEDLKSLRFNFDEYEKVLLFSPDFPIDSSAKNLYFYLLRIDKKNPKIRFKIQDVEYKYVDSGFEDNYLGVVSIRIEDKLKGRNVSLKMEAEKVLRYPTTLGIYEVGLLYVDPLDLIIRPRI